MNPTNEQIADMIVKANFPNGTKIYHAIRRELDAKDAQMKVLKDALEKISKTDTSDAVDAIWLCNWRNNTKQLAQLALKKCESV